MTGEDVTYTYDLLNRLLSASTTAGPVPWGQGCLRRLRQPSDQNVTQGSALTLHVTVRPTTNRVNGVSYDANGNDLTKTAWRRPA